MSSTRTTPAQNPDESFTSDVSTPTGRLKRRTSNQDKEVGSMDDARPYSYNPKRMRSTPTSQRVPLPEFPQHTGDGAASVSTFPAATIPIRSDRPEDDEVQQSTSSKSADASRNSSMVGSVVTAASSVPSNSFSAVNRQAVAESAAPGHDQKPDLQQSMMKKSPTFATSAAGVAWNPVNSSRPSLGGNTPTPTPPPMGAHPYGKPNKPPYLASASRPPPTPSPALPSEATPGSDKEMFIRRASGYQSQISALEQDIATRQQSINEIGRAHV